MNVNISNIFKIIVFSAFLNPDEVYRIQSSHRILGSKFKKLSLTMEIIRGRRTSNCIVNSQVTSEKGFLPNANTEWEDIFPEIGTRR